MAFSACIFLEANTIEQLMTFFWMSLKDHGRGILVLGEIMEANLVCTHSITVVGWCLSTLAS